MNKIRNRITVLSDKYGVWIRSLIFNSIKNALPEAARMSAARWIRNYVYVFLSLSFFSPSLPGMSRFACVRLRGRPDSPWSEIPSPFRHSQQTWTSPVSPPLDFSRLLPVWWRHRFLWHASIRRRAIRREKRERLVRQFSETTIRSDIIVIHRSNIS